MWGTDGNLENPFGGGVYLNVSDKKTSDDNKAFFLTFWNVPEEACMELATYDWGSSSSSGLIALSIGGGTPVQYDYKGCTGRTSSNLAVACPSGSSVSVPMSVSVAATACQSGDDNEINWKFY